MKHLIDILEGKVTNGKPCKPTQKMGLCHFEREPGIHYPYAFRRRNIRL